MAPNSRRRKEGNTFNGRLEFGDLMWENKKVRTPKEEKEVMRGKVVLRHGEEDKSTCCHSKRTSRPSQASKRWVELSEEGEKTPSSGCRGGA
jgi:hypothetical protein